MPLHLAGQRFPVSASPGRALEVFLVDTVYELGNLSPRGCCYHTPPSTGEHTRFTAPQRKPDDSPFPTRPTWWGVLASLHRPSRVGGIRTPRPVASSCFVLPQRFAVRPGLPWTHRPRCAPARRCDEGPGPQSSGCTHPGQGWPAISDHGCGRGRGAGHATPCLTSGTAGS
jgi:hypothetical protein